MGGKKAKKAVPNMKKLNDGVIKKNCSEATETSAQATQHVPITAALKQSLVSRCFWRC